VLLIKASTGFVGEDGCIVELKMLKAKYVCLYPHFQVYIYFEVKHPFFEWRKLRGIILKMDVSIQLNAPTGICQIVALVFFIS
jgi:hypothetical protein